MGTPKRKRSSLKNDGDGKKKMAKKKAPVTVIITAVDLHDGYVGKKSSATTPKKIISESSIVMTGPHISIIQHASVKKCWKRKKGNLNCAISKDDDDDSALNNKDLPNPFPSNEVEDKYWDQRYRFFKLYDNGIKLDCESWFSVTPETIAVHTANRVASKFMTDSNHNDTANKTSKEITILDAFCGCGGNAINFARQPAVRQVVCIDIDVEKLRLTANNAAVYGIPSDKLLLIHGDSMEIMRDIVDQNTKDLYEDNEIAINDGLASVLLEKHRGYNIFKWDVRVILALPQIDVVFLSPPWGGPEYVSLGWRQFDLLKHIQINSSQICDTSSEDKKHILVDHIANAPGEGQLNKTTSENILNNLKDLSSMRKSYDSTCLFANEQAPSIKIEASDKEKLVLNDPSSPGPCPELNSISESQCITAKIGDSFSQRATSADKVFDGVNLLKLASRVTSQKYVVYFLPKTLNATSLGRAAYRAGYRGFIELEKNLIRNKLKTYTAFVGFDCSSLCRSGSKVVITDDNDNTYDVKIDDEGTRKTAF